MKYYNPSQVFENGSQCDRCNGPIAMPNAAGHKVCVKCTKAETLRRQAAIQFVDNGIAQREVECESRRLFGV
jgi:hypothetical protein